MIKLKKKTIWIDKRYFITFIAISILVLIVSYVWFVFEKPLFSTGAELKKSDWLGFWGSYLAFIGAVFLGTVSIWQNKQANETNKTMIKENRELAQIDFENELLRKKYQILIDCINSINIRLHRIMTNINNPPSEFFLGNLRAFWQVNKTDIDLFISSEIDCMLPICYDIEFPEIIALKEELKRVLKINIDIIENNISVSNNSSEFELIINNFRICSTNIIQNIAYFHKKINAIESYNHFEHKNKNII